eukprot:363366-Chlamydomonas_euryale.AAC.5
MSPLDKLSDKNALMLGSTGCAAWSAWMLGHPKSSLKLLYGDMASENKVSQSCFRFCGIAMGWVWCGSRAWICMCPCGGVGRSGVEPESSPWWTLHPLPSPLSAVPRTPDPLSAVPCTPDPLSAVPRMPDPLSAVPRTPDPLSAVPRTPDPFSAVPRTPDPLSAVPRTPDSCPGTAG